MPADRNDYGRAVAARARLEIAIDRMLSRRRSRVAGSEKKSARQLDGDIADALSARNHPTRRQRQLMSKLQPVEGLRIPAAADRELTRFWQRQPGLRAGCLRKYGFDPIYAAADYWRFGLAEPPHASVVREIRRNGGVFSLPLVRRWEAELNAIGWRDFLLWAWREPQMREQFTAVTGVEIRSVATPIDVAIDAATGARESLASRFIEWATRAHWGLEHAPRAYQESLAKAAETKSSKRRGANGG